MNTVDGGLGSVETIGRGGKVLRTDNSPIVTVSPFCHACHDCHDCHVCLIVINIIPGMTIITDMTVMTVMADNSPIVSVSHSVISNLQTLCLWTLSLASSFSALYKMQERTKTTMVEASLFGW